MNRSEALLLSHVKASLVAGAYRRIPAPAHGSVSRVRICSARRARRGRTDRRETVRKTGLALIVVAASDRVWAECFGLEVVIWPPPRVLLPLLGCFHLRWETLIRVIGCWSPPHRRRAVEAVWGFDAVTLWRLHVVCTSFSCRQVFLFMHKRLSVS